MSGGVAVETGEVGAGVPARLAFVDLAALLTPIQDAAPAGIPLRYDPVYDRIREARREDDSSLPQGIWTRDLKKADWSEVDRVGSTAMVMRGKDLQVGGWLLEAWIHLHGFAGTRQGFELLFGLADRFWATLHPLPDGTDFGARTATIEWVNERLVTAIAAIPVTAPEDHAVRAWTWSERDDVLRHENEQRRAMPKGGKPVAPVDPKGAQFTFGAFEVSADATPRLFFAEAVDDLSAAITAARALVMIVDERCGTDAPSLSQAIDTMTAIREWMKPLAATAHAQDALGGDPAVDEMPAAPPEQDDAPTHGERMDPLTDAGAASPTDHARARADAYRKLAEAAQTLMRIEPHSPTPYLVRRAIAWGGMSLAELMRHFIDSGYDLKSLYSMLGMDEGEER